MLKIVIQQPQKIAPFQQPARDLRVLNKPLWLLQRDALAEICDSELIIAPGEDLPEVGKECLVFQDHLYFDSEFIKHFVALARSMGKAVQLAFKDQDPAIKEHILPLTQSFQFRDGLVLAPIWYYPSNTKISPEPLVVEFECMEAGYYHVPAYMAGKLGDLTYHIPTHPFLAIESWVHIFYANIIFGVFARGLRQERLIKQNLSAKLRALWCAMLEGKQLLDSSFLVKVGANSSIDPSAIIHGPTTIGDNVTIGAGVVIENSIIGDNVNISQGAQIMLSVVGDNVFLPFRAALFMTTLMENSTVAQNACLQMCVIGRNTFIGAGTTFTDFNLLPVPIRARNAKGELVPSNRPVLGGAVGHNCRIGSGFIIYPGRMIDSDVVLINSARSNVIAKDVSFAESHHHQHRHSSTHQVEYSDDEDTTSQHWK